MAQKKKVVKKVNKDIAVNDRGKYLRQRCRNAKITIQKKDGTSPNTLYKRQIQDIVDDPFTTEIYKTMELLSPPYSFSRLYTIYEESDILQECVDTMRQNVDGFGYQLHFLGDDKEQRMSSVAQAQYTKASNFFDYANESQSWIKIRKLMRPDFEVLGNSALEAIRNHKRELQLVYEIPFRTIRLAKSDQFPTRVTAKILRDGKIIEIALLKYFRRFVQIKSTGTKARWFKSFGDPRILDAETGEYITDVDGNILKGKKKPKIEASEIIHFKNDFGGTAYGIPRWIGTVLDVLGRRKAQYVNYDLFENQGIPPIAITVSGGALTDESVEELRAMIEGMRGVEHWNKLMLLESDLQSTGLEEKGAAKIEIKNLTEYRKDDQMFERYMKTTEKVIRHSYRLPPLYTGSSESFTHATSKSARLVAEEQVFIPERKDFDEFVNMSIMKNELNTPLWEYITKGPKIVGAEDMSKGVETFSKAGAFTVNHAVEMANEAFGLQMSKFSEKWADYPVPIVLKLVERGQLGELESITGDLEVKEVENPIPKQDIETANKNVKKMESIKGNIFDSNIFSAEDKSLYLKLLTIQQAVEENGGDTCTK